MGMNRMHRKDQLIMTAVASILFVFHVFLNEAELSDKVKEVQERRTADLEALLKEAVLAGELVELTDARLAAVMIHGFFREICFNWKLSGYSFSLKERSLSSLELFLTALPDKS